MADIESDIVNILQLLALHENLKIPDYQRPYKWSEKNALQLIDDIISFKDSGNYRIGTIVFHKTSSELNIVDGQQRIITFVLIINALIQKQCKIKTNNNLINKLNTIKKHLFNPEFKNEISKHNIINNFKSISFKLDQILFFENFVEFFLEKCEVVIFKLNYISEAFQFFDSQNSRGKELEPHDLLKAFHLRELGEEDSQKKIKIIKDWENSDTKELSNLFSSYLYPIKKWLNGKKAFVFKISDIDIFKGINLKKDKNLPYAKLLIMAHYFVDEYNNQYQRQFDGLEMDFPFQINQQIINGRRFFEMIGYYLRLKNKIAPPQKQVGHFNNNIIKELEGYKEKSRTGDQYARDLFNALIFNYIDKFGDIEIDQAIKKCFLIAYKIRLEYQVLRWDSIENYIQENSFFKDLNMAKNPNEFLNIEIDKVVNIRSTPSREKGEIKYIIEQLFVEFNHA